MKKVTVFEDLNYSGSHLKEDIVFEVAPNKQLYIYLKDIEEATSLHFDVGDNSNVQLSIFAKNPIENGKITANIGENSNFLVYFADFTVKKNHLDASIVLAKNNGSCEWHLASLSSKGDDKEIAVSIYHEHPNTHGKIDNYGVCKEESTLIFSGISHIVKGCHRSTSHQNAKIVVFDDNCKAVVKPILKIDENDIEASHAAVVGKINDDHIFYLTSRGLTVEESKLLITLGYLKPIAKGFDEETANEIYELIEGRL